MKHQRKIILRRGLLESILCFVRFVALYCHLSFETPLRIHILHLRRHNLSHYRPRVTKVVCFDLVSLNFLFSLSRLIELEAQTICCFCSCFLKMNVNHLALDWEVSGFSIFRSTCATSCLRLNCEADLKLVFLLAFYLGILFHWN